MIFWLSLWVGIGIVPAIAILGHARFIKNDNIYLGELIKLSIFSLAGPLFLILLIILLFDEYKINTLIKQKINSFWKNVDNIVILKKK